MIFVLEIYDILKRVRKSLKVNEKLSAAQKPGSSGAVYASDETVKEYTVVNHRDQV